MVEGARDSEIVTKRMLLLRAIIARVASTKQVANLRLCCVWLPF